MGKQFCKNVFPTTSVNSPRVANSSRKGGILRKPFTHFPPLFSLIPFPYTHSHTHKAMLKNTSYTITYFAKNLETGTRYSGDSGNHTCMISKDGGGFSLASNRPTDIGNGLYALKLTATETDCDFFTLYVGSSTTNIFIEPVRLTFNDPEQFKADVSGLATSSQVEALQTAVNAIPTEVWSESSRTLSDAVNVSTAAIQTIQNGLATSSALTSVSGKIDTLDAVCDTVKTLCTSINTTCGTLDETCDAILVRTNLIPDQPAATGSAMTLTDAYSGLLSLDADSIASAVLACDISNVENVAPLYSLCTIILAHLQSSVNGNAWTIYRTNGITEHARRTVQVEENSAPISGVSDS